MMDIIDGDEELTYINEDATIETDKTESRVSAQEKGDVRLREDLDPTKGLKARDPIDLASTDTEVPEGGSSRSPPPTFDEVERNVGALTGDDDALGHKGSDRLVLETSGALSLMTFSSFLANFLHSKLDLPFLWLFSGYYCGHDGDQRQESSTREKGSIWIGY